MSLFLQFQMSIYAHEDGVAMQMQPSDARGKYTIEVYHGVYAIEIHYGL